MNTISLPNNLIGRFYFKRTQNGNLIGEFSNNNSFSNSTESADVVNSTDNFIGEYKTTWREEDEATFAKLTISHKAGSSNSILQLKWTDLSGNPMYIGEGFLFDGILIGDYRDFIIA